MPSGTDVAITTTYHNYAGSKVTRDAYVYFNSVTIDPGKTVAFLTLPTVSDHTTGSTPALHVFAVGLAN